MAGVAVLVIAFTSFDRAIPSMDTPGPRFERMSRILSRVRQGPSRFVDLIDPEEGRLGVVVCFLAVLELARSTLVEVRQDGPFEAILLAPPGRYEEPKAEEEVS